MHFDKICFLVLLFQIKAFADNYNRLTFYFDTSVKASFFIKNFKVSDVKFQAITKLKNVGGFECIRLNYIINFSAVKINKIIDEINSNVRSAYYGCCYWNE